jgi:hypothetical protein
MYKYVKVQETVWIDYDNNNESLLLPTVVSVKQTADQITPEPDEFLYSGIDFVEAMQIYMKGKFYNSIREMQEDSAT